MANLPTKFVSLREDIFRGTKPLRVDREKGVIHEVKLLGLTSSNGRTYTLEAIRNAAKMYEGKVVNIDHRAKPGQPRSAYDRFGRVVNVRVDDQGLFGNIEYLKSHPMADRVSEAAERMPAIFGMSHDAQGIPRPGNGKHLTIESITSVASVDVVSDPATVKSLFEQEQSMEPEMAPEMSPEEQLKAGFEAAVLAVVKNDQMDVSAKVTKIKDLLKTQEKLMMKDEEMKDEGEASAEEKPAEEQAEVKTPTEPTAQQLTEQVQQFQRTEKARSLCDAAGLIPTPVQLKALVALTEETEQKALIQGFKAVQSNGQKPKSTAPAQQLTEQKAEKATDGKSLAKLLKRRR